MADARTAYLLKKASKDELERSRKFLKKATQLFSHYTKIYFDRQKKLLEELQK